MVKKKYISLLRKKKQVALKFIHHLFFFFLSFFFSFSRSFLAISRISNVSFSEESIEAENADGPPKYVDLVEALDKLRRRFSFTASLSNNFALLKRGGKNCRPQITSIANVWDKYSLASRTAMH